MCSAFSSSWSQALWRMSKSIVRDALLTSVACSAPPLRRHSSQLSTVPKASSPRAAARCAPLTWSSSQRSLVAEKYGSMRSPVECCTIASSPCARNWAHSGSVRRSCQTMALCSGLPVRRSHSSVVSRWLVMPMARMSPAFKPALAMASRAVSSCVVQMSSGSCSTQPGCGKICRNSRCALATMRPCSSKTMLRELEVPWSRASRWLTVFRLPAPAQRPAIDLMKSIARCAISALSWSIVATWYEFSSHNNSARLEPTPLTMRGPLPGLTT